MMTRVKVFFLLLVFTGIGLFFRWYTPSSTWSVLPSSRFLTVIWPATSSPPTPKLAPNSTAMSTPKPASNLTTKSTPKPGPTPKLCSCARCLTQDEELLRHRQELFHQPFLTWNYSLPEADFRWWTRMQNERGSQSTYQDMVNRLFEVFPHVPDVAEPRPERCRSCAVVGNSANLKGSKYGKLIDSQDAVIRMNFGPIKGFEEDIGTRTTHRALYPESATNLDNTTHMVLFAFKILDLDWLLKASTSVFTGRSYAPVPSKIQVNKSLVMIINPALMRYAHETLLENHGHYSSTGFMTLVLALHMCDEVHVFGFGADSEGNWSHYWQALRNSNTVNQVHPVKHEYEVIQRLAQQGKFQFYKGV